MGRESGRGASQVRPLLHRGASWLTYEQVAVRKVFCVFTTWLSDGACQRGRFGCYCALARPRPTTTAAPHAPPPPHPTPHARVNSLLGFDRRSSVRRSTNGSKSDAQLSAWTHVVAGPLRGRAWVGSRGRLQRVPRVHERRFMMMMIMMVMRVIHRPEIGFRRACSELAVTKCCCCAGGWMVERRGRKGKVHAHDGRHLVHQIGSAVKKMHVFRRRRIVCCLSRIGKDHVNRAVKPHRSQNLGLIGVEPAAAGMQKHNVVIGSQRPLVYFEQIGRHVNDARQI